MTFRIPQKSRNQTISDKIFAQDSAVVKIQNYFSSHGGFLTYAMYHHRETTKPIKKTNIKEIKERSTSRLSQPAEPRWAQP